MLPPLVPMLIRPSDHPSVPFIDGHLHLGLAVGPEARFVTEEELLAWDRPFDRLCDHAVLNLRGRTARADVEPVRTIDGLFRVQTDDGLAATRMLCLDELVRPWPLEGAIVACPDPDRLLIVPLEGLATVSALRAVLKLLAEWRVERRALSDQLFWCDRERGWSHVPVRHKADGAADLMPVPGLSAALDRALAIDIGEAAEA